MSSAPLAHPKRSAPAPCFPTCPRTMSSRSSKRAISIQDAVRHEASPLTERLASSDAALFIEELVVEENYAGWRIDRYLTEKIRRASRSQVRNYLERNVEMIPPRKVKSGTIVRTGDIIRIIRSERVMPDTPTEDALDVLFLQGDTAVVTKPPGVIVHRNSREVSHTMDALLTRRFPDRAHVEAVHRLDRDTSGCMLCAFGRDAVVRWRNAFSGREISKVYLAIVEDPERQWYIGRLIQIQLPLGPDPNSEVRVRMGHGDLDARTGAICIHREGDRALIELHPHEGRQHQLRAHLALTGTPITGDKLYLAGDDYFIRWSDDPAGTQELEPLATPWHCLHAWKISFAFEGKRHTIEAPVPPHFYDAMPTLKLP